MNRARLLIAAAVAATLLALPATAAANLTFPDGPSRTEGVTDYLFGPGVPEALADEVMAFSRRVGDEDALLVASVQRGLASAMVPEGRLMPRSERLIAHFQGLVREALAHKAV